MAYLPTKEIINGQVDKLGHFTEVLDAGLKKKLKAEKLQTSTEYLQKYRRGKKIAPHSHKFWESIESLKEYIAKNQKAALLFVDFSKAFVFHTLLCV